MLSFECIKNEKSVYFLLTSAYSFRNKTNWTYRDSYASFAQIFLIFWASDFTDFLYVQIK